MALNKRGFLSIIQITVLVIEVPHDSVGQARFETQFGNPFRHRIGLLKFAHIAHLSGYCGTQDGIIGAAAGVGLTLSGWSGRFIEFNGLRGFETTVKVADLEAHGIRVLSIDRNALVCGADDWVDTRDWLRPRLWGGRPVLPVASCGPGAWRSIAAKNKK